MTPSPNFTRRSLFAGAAVVAAATALAASPSMLAASPSSAAWDAAVSAYKAARVAMDEQAKITAAIEMRYIDQFYPTPAFKLTPDQTSDAPRLLAEHMARTDAANRFNADLRIDIGLAAAEDEDERLGDLWVEARDVVFETPAPDLVAVAYKLTVLGEHSHLAAETNQRSPLALIAADVSRLASA